ncbi:MAG: hypothetical protein LBC71_04960 [Oscillospiraceae bacterium]|nr:hypothetical protein [Oscillospiraceae bacterium]
MNEVFLLLKYTFGGYTLIFILLIGLIIACIGYRFLEGVVFIAFIGGILLLIASILLTIFNIEFELLPLMYQALAVCIVICIAFEIFDSISLARKKRQEKLKPTHNKSKPSASSSKSTSDSSPFLICPWFSENLSMCIQTDEFMDPNGNRTRRYCTTSNCVNCPDYV